LGCFVEAFGPSFTGPNVFQQSARTRQLPSLGASRNCVRDVGSMAQDGGFRWSELSRNGP
jgi:hypothetical protein